MRDILGRISFVSGVSAIAAALLLGLIVISVMARTPDRAVLDEGVQPAEQQQSSDTVPEEAQPKEMENLNGALDRLGHIRAEESTAFQAYNNALYEQKQLDEEIGQLDAQPDELEAKQQLLIETTDEVAARKERFESVEAEKQAYLDSLSSELRAQIEAEQQRRIEEAQAEAEAAAAEIRERLAAERERLASEASALAAIPPQPIQEFEAQIPQVEEPESQLGLQAAEVGEAPETQETAQLAADLEYPEEVELDQQQEILAAQGSDPPPPPPEVASAVVAEAASFLGTQAVEDAPAPEALTVQPEPAPAGASADQYGPQEPTSNLQQQDATTEGLQPSSSQTGTQPAHENRTASPVTPSGQAVVDEGAKYSGTKYKLGGVPECVPYETMDCSCLTMTVYAEFGIYLPDSPEAQMGYGTPVSGEPQAGDLVGWSEDHSGVITHVGIATGHGTTIHASGYAGYVTETPIEYIPGYVGARRLL